MFPLLENGVELIITAGGPCSNFLRAISLECAQHGLKLWIVSYTDREEEYNSLNYHLTKRAGAKIIRCQKCEVAEKLDELKYQAEKTNCKWEYVYGGAEGSPAGIMAYYDAVKALKNQISRYSPITDIWVPCGTGTTVTGLSFGCEDILPQVRVHGVSVARDKNAVWHHLFLNRETFCRDKKLYSLKNLTIHEFGGYSHYNPEVDAVCDMYLRNEGIVLDPIYSGRAATCMGKWVTEHYEGIHLLWITGGLINGLSEINNGNE